ncbi:MAG TPA: helix-turn-helix domain-containing protein [Chthonomonadales bacterium]|nr:helix-turn-helix domain-containing protein [Chthonomonadales bacterium]
MTVGPSAEALLGLTEYEARVYRAMLEEGPATAYRLGVRSGVPLSRVYGVVARLAEKGAAVAGAGDPRTFRAVPPGRLIADARERAMASLNRLERELSALGGVGHGKEPIWIAGEQAALAAAIGLLRCGGVEVLWAAGPEAAPELLDAARRSRVACPPPAQFPEGKADPWAFVVAAPGQGMLVGRLRAGGGAAMVPGALPAALATAALAPRRRGAAHAKPLPAHDGLAHDWLEYEARKQNRLLSAH